MFKALRSLFAKSAASIMPQLLLAKAESDRRNYAAKHRIMRQLIRDNPADFFIDSGDQPGVVGITHRRTGFRLHLPKGVIPVPLSNSAVQVQGVPRV